MFEKLLDVEKRYDSLTAQLSDPKVASDPDAYRKVAKEHAALTPLVEEFREYKKVRQGIADAEEMLQGPLDPEMRGLAQAELDDLKPRLAEFESVLRVMLLPKDPNDEKDVIVEFRPGTGGDEAELFTAELLRMYMRYAERRGWKPELLNAQETGIGGVKDASLSIHGQGAYSQLKFEGGVHRVQRVPATESGGRIHTSTASVAVMPEVEETTCRSIRATWRSIPIFRRRGRAERPEERDGGPHPAQADRHRRGLPGPAPQPPEPRAGPARVARAPVRDGACKRSRKIRRRPGVCRSARATAPTRSAPTTSRRTASPTTASV